jgi:Holliday junction resolvase RusA-like endonuclease
LKEPAQVWHAKKPDCDNIAKALLDALTTLGFWTDDALVAECEIIKKYVQGKTYAPGAMIEIREAVL